MKMTEEKDEFEKLKKRIKEDTWEDYEGNHSHIDYDTIIEIIEEFKPKLKTQILQENPMAGLTDEWKEQFALELWEKMPRLWKYYENFPEKKQEWSKGILEPILLNTNKRLEELSRREKEAKL